MYYMKVKYTYLSRDTQTISKLSNLVNKEDLFGILLGRVYVVVMVLGAIIIRIRQWSLAKENASLVYI